MPNSTFPYRSAKYSFSIISHILISPEVETEFGKALPAWIKVQRGIDEKQKEKLHLLVDLGEASAIALALERKNCFLIIDEKKGRKLAETLNIKIAGTLQILLLAKVKGVITSLSHEILQLEQSGFQISAIIKKEMLKLANEV